MDARSLATVLAITAGVAGAVVLCAPSVRGDPRTHGAAATAAAIEAQMAWAFIDAEGRSHAADTTLPRLSLCVSSTLPLDFAALSQALERTRLRPVPATQCTGSRLGGAANGWSDWRDENGAQASVLIVSGIDCPATTRCFIELDAATEGGAYEVQHGAKGWYVTETVMRWMS
jgi:hypothetical protein